MNNIIFLLLLSFCAYSCVQNADDIEADEIPKTVTEQVLDSGTPAENSLLVQRNAEWQNFRTKSDSMIRKLDDDLTKFDSSFVKVNEMDIVYMNHKMAKEDLRDLKDELKSENINFVQSREQSDNMDLRKNEIFKKNFRMELTKVGASVKNLFDFNR